MLGGEEHQRLRDTILARVERENKRMNRIRNKINLQQGDSRIYRGTVEGKKSLI